jgi:hypothetical protein
MTQGTGKEEDEGRRTKEEEEEVARMANESRKSLCFILLPSFFVLSHVR